MAPPLESNRPRILILGAGYGGAYCAQRLESRLRPDEAEVVLIDRQNYFVFFPLLVEAGTGSLEPRHAIVPIRAFIRSTEFIMAQVTGLDVERQTVSYALTGPDEESRDLHYDHLVIALGSVTNLPDVPGLLEHGFQMKSLADAVALRDRAIAMLERANTSDDEQMRRELLHFVVVGGNFTGVEVTGEYEMFLRQARRAYRHVDSRDIRVTLVELGSQILTPLGPDLGAFAMKHLQSRGVDVRLNESVASIESDHVVLAGGETLRARTVIWCAGIQQTPLVATFGLPSDERGYLRCERDLRIDGRDNIWAIGDCALNTDRDGRAYPTTAQHAVRQGRHLANNLRAVLRGKPTRPCDIVSRGSLAAMGCRTGVAEVLGFKLSGFGAWWLWRTVYLLKMPGLGRKLRVALDWTVGLFFARDYVQLGLHRPGRNRPSKGP